MGEGSPKFKWLLATHHLFRWGGSELVTIELAEELAHRGHEVVIYTPFSWSSFIDEALGDTFEIITKPEAVNLSQFDIVYSHHQSISRTLPHQQNGFADQASDPVFIYNHLSPYEQFEFPGPFVEESLADIILCNSLETGKRLASFGDFFSTSHLFPNPAPTIYERPAEVEPRRKLKRLLSVSNHTPPELASAFRILSEQGVEITRIGRPDREYRVSAADISSHDAVVTIGKTVQYALRGRRPVYCYDHFGGPGWLNTDNFAETAANNFSGRCTRRKAAPEDIARELQNGFDTAFQRAQKVTSDFLAPYCLENAVDALLAYVERIRQTGTHLQATSAERRSILQPLWSREAGLYELVDRHFNGSYPQEPRTGTRLGSGLRAYLGLMGRKIFSFLM